MRHSMLVVCVLLAGTTLGCDRWNLLVDKIKNRNKPPTTAARDTTKHATPGAPAATGTTKAPATNGAKATPTPGAKGPVNTITPAAPVASAPKPTPPPPQRNVIEPAPSHPVLADEPYNSADTGTIAPGMSAKDVEALWGPPAARRSAGAYTYLLYPNGCEHTCGTEDLVILQNDQVVDAVLRWHGHGYSGQSSSPRALPPGRNQVTTP
ncbi:MAG TPA: hypothetical protein VFP39_15775 [Gemmatimonadales bacterium]|nr:hypothetical protein [Gemmatimonadales bacterium]